VVFYKKFKAPIKKRLPALNPKGVLQTRKNQYCPYCITNIKPATASITAQTTTKTNVVNPEMLLTSIFPPVRLF